MSDYATTCTRCHGTGLRLDRNESGPCEATPAWSSANRVKEFFVCRASGQKIRKNGTCSEHACYWCDGTPKLSPRAAFLQEIGRRVDSIDAAYAAGTWIPAEEQAWRELCGWIADNGPAVSRAERWQAACAWFDGHRTADAPRWAVTQGTVWLCHANGR